MSRPDKTDSVQSDLRKGRSFLTVIVEGIEGIALVAASVLFWSTLLLDSGVLCFDIARGPQLIFKIFEK